MAISKTEVWKEIRPKLPSYLDEDERLELNEEIGDYVVTAMLDLLGDGKSPVTGEDFKKLSDKYAGIKGTDLPNMELEGDLLSSLTYEPDAYSVKIGFWDEEQAIKAYGHNTGMKGHPWLDGKAPVRKIIPTAKEKFESSIQEGIDQIIQEFLDAREDSEAASGA